MEGWEPGRSGGAPETARFFGRIQPAVALVFECTRLVTVKEASRACSMSRNAFAFLFKAIMGITFVDFALRHRITGAAARLANTGEPIKAIASEWGFADMSHFARCFVRHYGVSPGAYRKTTTERAFYQEGAP
jgi:AraC-like DNA-binding protein